MNRIETRNTAIQQHANWFLSEADRLEAALRLHNVATRIKFPGEASGCRPNWILNKATKALPGIWSTAEEVQKIIGKSWPYYCYMPLSVWHVAIAQVLDTTDYSSQDGQAELAALIELVNILGNWRVGQGIYRFDPSLFESVANTPFNGPLSLEIFSRLPEWGIYVETPGLEVFDYQLHGFFACLNHSPKMGATLRLALDTDVGLRPCTLALDQPSISNALLNVVAPLASSHRCEHTDEKLEKFTCICETEQGYIEPLISLLNFICTCNDEISDAHGAVPSRPKVQKTKRGERVFPATTSNTWDVGMRLGAELRRTLSSALTSSENDETDKHGTAKRPHVRVGHWHHARLGRRTDDNGNFIPTHLRKQSKKWVPAKLINCNSPDELVPTIHPVPVE